MSALFLFSSSIYLINEISLLFNYNESPFVMSTYYNSTKSIEFKDFTDSFGMILGTTNLSIDLFNNPYFQLNVYEFD